MAYCPTCGEDNLEDARFCTACGKALPERARTDAADTASAGEGRHRPRWRQGAALAASSRLTIVASLFAGLVIGFGLAELFAAGGKSGPAASQTLALNVSPTPALSGRLMLTPSSGTFLAGDSFSVELVVSAREPFNAAQAAVSLSPNLAVQTIAEPPSTHGPCDFTNYSHRPTPADPSFAGSYASGFASLSCTVYVLEIRALRSGTATITLSGESILASSDGRELFGTANGGIYTIAGTAPSDNATPSSGSNLHLATPTAAMMAGRLPKRPRARQRWNSTPLFDDAEWRTALTWGATPAAEAAVLLQRRVTAGAAQA
jgi:hypothetical protein